MLFRRKTGYEFLANIAPNVGINIYKVNEVITSEVNFIISIIEKCKYHQSIKAIKTHIEKKDKPNFRFNEITKSIVVKEIKKRNPRKTSQSNDISKKLIKEFYHIIANDSNKCLNSSTFSESFKILEAIPVYKKEKTTDKNIYRLKSMLSNLSKLMNAYFHNVLSKFQCCVRKGYRADHCLPCRPKS